jgi:hypothetical protein
MKKIRAVVSVMVSLGVAAAACGEYGPGTSADSGQGGANGTGGAANPTCGNGVVDTGETCDPPGSCPASCDDGNACTMDPVTGSAATCDIACGHTPISACVPGDGCCPTGCTAATDADCSASCGNGTIDANETCDPPESCPAGCDDGNACTVDSLTGSAANCNGTCSHSSITSCSSGDGCCPTSCDSSTDTDCSVGCGNGIVEAGETCDPPESCPANCNDGNACTVDQLTGNSQNCNVACSSSAISTCAPGDGCCPTGCTTATDSDCSSGCGDGVIEGGETCDPPETCPESCDDGNACTVDQRTGSVQNCNVACSHSSISTCVSGDGCCPTGCDSTDDDDCSVSCGNEVVEDGETCDPPGSCPTSCDDGDVCTRDQLTGSAQNCNATCGSTTITACSSGDGCCPSTCSFANDSDCGAPLPCDVLEGAGVECVSAHSTVRVIVSGYTGPLYQLCKGNAVAGPSSCQGETKNIESVNGYADVETHEAFCGGAPNCTITTLFDQSGQGNDLEPAPRGGAKPTPDLPADASALPVSIHGHSVYGILIEPGIGYRTGCSGCNIKTGHGTAVGDEPQTMYWVTSQHDLVNGCCFDYGNGETTSNDDGNGTMETIYFGQGVIWGTGVQGGPWVMADLENGLYAGWENGQDKNISTNTPLKYDFVTNVVIGDTRDKNNGKGRFALYGGDATAGALTTMYDGVRPEKPGYVPMQKQGSVILGIGGDNSNSAGGRFYEGVMANGVAPKDVVDALQDAIVAAGYGS